MMKCLLFLLMLCQLSADPEPSSVSEPGLSVENAWEGQIAYSYSELDHKIVLIKEARSTARSYYEICYYLHDDKCVYALLVVRALVWDEKKDDWRRDESGALAWEERTVKADFDDGPAKNKMQKALFSEENMDRKFLIALDRIRKTCRSSPNTAGSGK